MLSVSVGDVAPARATPLRDHWKLGVGLPVATTLKVTFCPTAVVTLAGCVVIAGAVLTASAAAALVTVVAPLPAVTTTV